ncbi:MAG: YkvA family protein [Cyclobacteriaceae bacterium]
MSKYSQNNTFKETLRQAEKVAMDQTKLQWLIDRVSERIDNFDSTKGRLNEFLFKVQTFIRMIRAYIKGHYRDIPWKSMLLITAALLYFLTPFDIIPDFIPVIGLVDDVSIVLWVFKSLNDDISKFLNYEQELMSRH